MTRSLSLIAMLVFAACDTIELEDLSQTKPISEYQLRVSVSSGAIDPNIRFEIAAFAGASTAGAEIFKQAGTAAELAPASGGLPVNDYMLAATSDAVQITLRVFADLKQDNQHSAFEPATTATITLHRKPVAGLNAPQQYNYVEEYGTDGVMRGVFVVGVYAPGNGGYGTDTAPYPIEEGRVYELEAYHDSFSTFSFVPSKNEQYLVIYSQDANAGIGAGGTANFQLYGPVSFGNGAAGVHAKSTPALTAGTAEVFTLALPTASDRLKVAVMPIPAKQAGASAAYVAVGSPEYAVAPIEAFVMNSAVTIEASSNDWVPSQLQYYRPKQGSELNDPRIVFGNSYLNAWQTGFYDASFQYVNHGGQVFDITGSSFGSGATNAGQWLSVDYLNIGNPYHVPEVQFVVGEVESGGIRFPIAAVARF